MLVPARTNWWIRGPVTILLFTVWQNPITASPNLAVLSARSYFLALPPGFSSSMYHASSTTPSIGHWSLDIGHWSLVISPHSERDRAACEGPPRHRPRREHAECAVLGGPAPRNR